MKNKLIKSLMNSLNSREREVSQGDLSMKKESNGIGENKNSKKISKNNKIISSILAIVMCCQSFVGAVEPSLNTNSRDNVVESVLSLLSANNNAKNDENNESKNKNKSFVDKFAKGCYNFFAEVFAETCCKLSIFYVMSLVVGITVCFRSTFGNAVKVCGRRYRIFKIGNRRDQFDGFGFENLRISPKYPEFFYVHERSSKSKKVFARKFADGTFDRSERSLLYVRDLNVESDGPNNKFSDYSKFIVDIFRCKKMAGSEYDSFSNVLKRYFSKKGIESAEDIIIYILCLLHIIQDPNFYLTELKFEITIADVEYRKRKHVYLRIRLPIPLELADKINEVASLPDFRY
ncbi:MAG: hypothetical protein CfP315_0017 [Candidatus Improbicoccus pseudotrichonymphae]|uniref:Uncharacterized protein n=1 Tax=Candidatus Improbicoccus pseudotrichonymphae TaxID=3033792 RepID=A0AA48KYR6_9FIRM|nr:MAG: hypothetical protein CfP315_0017 [Candidatus Improbicoccus pseudotrichonymphae]